MSTIPQLGQSAAGQASSLLTVTSQSCSTTPLTHPLPPTKGVTNMHILLLVSMSHRGACPLPTFTFTTHIQSLEQFPPKQ